MSLKDKDNIYIIVDNIDDFYNKLKLDTVYDVDLNRKYCNDNVGHSVFQKVKSINNNNDLIRLLAIFSEISNAFNSVLLDRFLERLVSTDCFK